jgi:hypothetical protein
MSITGLIASAIIDAQHHAPMIPQHELAGEALALDPADDGAAPIPQNFASRDAEAFRTTVRGDTPAYAENLTEDGAGDPGSCYAALMSIPRKSYDTA